MNKRNDSRDYNMSITLPSPSSILNFLKPYDKNDTTETKQLHSVLFALLAASGTWISIMLASIRKNPHTFDLLFLLTILAVPTLAINIYKPRSIVPTMLGLMLPHMLMYKSKW